MPETTPDFAAIKTRQQAAWSTGNYAVIGTSILLVPELLVEAMDIRAGWRVLDVAAGNGNASLAAARRWCRVVSTDYVPSLLDTGKLRARAEGYEIDFQVADAEALPFADATFDAALSTFGIMFAPDQQRAAAEMLRVVRPGGKLGLASWTPESFVGRIFKLIGKYIPPAPGMRPPFRWGTEEGLAELFPGAQAIKTHKRMCTFRHLSAEAWLEMFRTFYGPMNRTFAALDSENQAAFQAEILALMSEMNRSGDETLVLDSEYVEAVITT